MAPPNTSTAPYASRGRGNGLSEARLHSSSWCPRSATTSPKTPERTLSPWMTARTSISARRAHRNLLRLQQALQLLRVRRGLCHPTATTVRARRVVVEERVGLIRLLRQLPQRADPFPQFVIRVQVVEPLRCAAATFVPRRGVTAVEADVSRRARQGRHRRHEILRALD